jgi:DNA-binding winged helix-turn-helix (wHTH) protein
MRQVCWPRGKAEVEFSFGDHVLDLDRPELRRGAELVALEPQVFDLLVYLVQNRDRVVSKEDLLTAVWGGRIVSESTFTSRVSAARRAVGDGGEAQRWIRTVPRKGIRFVGVVEESRNAAVPLRPPPTLPEKPSIAVLPFANIGGDPEQAYFADGMIEKIIMLPDARP